MGHGVLLEDVLFFLKVHPGIYVFKNWNSLNADEMDLIFDPKDGGGGVFHRSTERKYNIGKKYLLNEFVCEAGL
jgi:hypothetical protein